MTRFLKCAILSAIYFFLYSPIVILIIYSFNQSRFSMRWHGFSWQWYQQLISDNSLWLAALHSVLLGLFAAAGATFIASVAAISIYRYRFFGKQFIQGLLFAFIILPDIVLAIAFFMLMSAGNFPFGFWSLLLAHITFCIPFVVVILSSRLSGFNEHLIDAAKDLGASDSVIFRKLMVPLLWPAIVAGFLISFTLSFDDVIISYFVAGPGFEILPLKIYSLARRGVTPEINALCSVIFIITFACVIAAQALIEKKP